MAFPTVPTSAAGRIVFALQANTTATRTFPDLSTLTKSSGDLLIAICVAYQTTATPGAAFSGWSAGWTEFKDQSSTTGMAIGMAYKRSTGSETGTISVTQAATITGHAAMTIMAIPGAHATTPPEAGAIANGTTAAADPAAFTPAGWGTEDTLWIAVGGAGETSTTGSFTGMNSAPTNYTDYFGTNFTSDVVGGCGQAVAFRQLNAASEDVAGFSVDTSNARNSALLVAVRPAAPTATPVARVSLASAGIPSAQTNHSIVLRARKQSGTGTVILNAALYEGATNRSGDLASTALTTSLADYTLLIADASAATITDYSNLELRFWGTSSTGDAVVVELANAKLVLPASAGATLALMSGTIAGVGTASGALTATPQVSGTIAGTAATTGAVTATSLLSGTIAGTATATGQVSIPQQITGTIAGVATETGSLTASPKLAGTIAGAATATGALTATPLLSGAIAGIATLSGALTAQTFLTGTIAGTGTATGALTASSLLTGTVAGVGTATGALTAASLLSGTAAGVLTVTGTLSIPGAAPNLSGTIAGVATVTGNLTATPLLSGTVSGVALATGSLTATSLLTGSIAGVRTSTGALTAASLLSGTTAGTNTTTGALTATPQLSGTMAGTATLTGTVTVPGSAALSGTVAGSGTMTGQTTVASLLTGTTAGATTATGSLTARPQLTGTVAGAYTTTGTIGTTPALSGTITGAAVFTGIVRTSAFLSGTVSANSTLTGVLIALNPNPDGRHEGTLGGTLFGSGTSGGTGSNDITEGGSIFSGRDTGGAVYAGATGNGTGRAD